MCLWILNRPLVESAEPMLAGHSEVRCGCPSGSRREKGVATGVDYTREKI